MGRRASVYDMAAGILKWKEGVQRARSRSNRQDDLRLDAKRANLSRCLMPWRPYMAVYSVEEA